MTITLMEGGMIDLNTQRAGTDILVGATVTAMPWWLAALHGPAQELAFWATVIVAVGRLAIFLLDVRHRVLNSVLWGKLFTRERLPDEPHQK